MHVQQLRFAVAVSDNNRTQLHALGQSYPKSAGFNLLVEFFFLF